MKSIFVVRNKIFSVFVIIFFILFIVACGGGGGSSSNTASPPATYSISGTVTGAANVTINLTDTASASTTTSGSYSFTGLSNGAYTVTPVKAGYIFAPANATVTVSGANVTGKDFVASIAPTYTSSDLTGTWVFHYLKVGNSPEWSYGTATIDSSGNLTFSSCLDSAAETSCPLTGTIKWTIDGNGVITESGSGASISTKMTMTSNKYFIAGTDGPASDHTTGSTEELRIVQKVTGTPYLSTDLQSKNFVYHQLTAGTSNAWEYGAGSIDGTNVITISSSTAPSGSVTPKVYGTLSLNTSTGMVTLSGSPTFQGFLSNDKKTIVGTETDGTNYRLMIIQITGHTYTAADLTGIYTAHYISEISDNTLVPASDSGVNALWINATMTVTAASSGNVFSSNVTSSWANITALTNGTAVIDPTGRITAGDNNYALHGQMSNDGKFAVFTDTQIDASNNNNNYYTLLVITK